MTVNTPSDLVEAKVNRRGFLFGAAGLAGAGVLVAACGSDNENTADSGDTGGDADNKADASGDAAVATFAAGLEVLAVNTYKGALDAATAGKLGAVPPAVATFVTTAMKHHQEHLDAWNGAITKGGGEAVTEPDATLNPVVAEKFGKVKDVGGAARLALELEEIAAATYLSALAGIKNKDSRKLAASIQAIDAKHAAILHFVLAEYPVPDVFAKTDKAAKPA
ncbi:MAG TPA: ferritin-like domain-containing protein [Acidimicrobiales bacterium]|nr:ferritin-like domain-containing protein [Acidimicrobiales bacterium]